jgi:hypothetical protein
MNHEYSSIEKLIERFFEGESSNEEEQQLYTFFNGNDIPQHLFPYRSLFAYFETGIKKENNHQDIRLITLRPFQKKSVFLWAGFAASLLIFISLGVYHLVRENDCRLYEGSYIVRNGIKITDPKVVIPEVKKTLLLAQQQKDEFYQMFQSMQEFFQEDPYEQILREIRQQTEWVEQLGEEIIPKELLEIINYQL